MKKGFTMVELMVVMVIIGILTGIGVSTMSSSTDAAKNMAAKANVRNMITSAQMYYTSNDFSYTGFTSTNPDVTVKVADNGSSFCAQATGSDTVTYKYNSATDSKVEKGTCS